MDLKPCSVEFNACLDCLYKYYCAYSPLFDINAVNAYTAQRKKEMVRSNKAYNLQGSLHGD